MIFLLSIILPSFVFVSVLLSFYLYRVVTRRNEVYEKGVVLGKIDMSTRKLFVYKMEPNKTIPRQFHLSGAMGKWVSLEVLFKNWKGSKAEKIMRSMLVDIQSGKPFVENLLLATTDQRKGRDYDVILKLFQIDDSSDIGFVLYWKLKTKPIKEKIFAFEPLTKVDVANKNFEYKGFVAFRLKSNIENVEQEFLEKLNKVYKLKRKIYFISNGVLVFVFGDKKNHKLKYKINNLIMLILSKKCKKNGLDRMYNGTSYAIGKNVSTPKRVNDVLELLSFNINLSLRLKKDFVNRENEEFSLDEYKVIVNATKIFKEAIKTKYLMSNEAVVTNTKNKKIMVYTYPTIKDISKEVTSMIMYDSNNKDILMDTYAEIISVDSKAKEPVMIDINNTWFANNYKKMKYKKAIYILNYNPFKIIDTEKQIKEMTEKGFTFAIRLRIFNEEITTVIKKSRPQFIVVDKSLSNIKEPENYIKLLSIKNLVDQEGLRLIYEEPSSGSDPSIAKMLGIKYLYKK